MGNRNGYPSLESLKLIADLFQMKIDELLSDDDIENKKLLDKKRSEKMYFLAVMFLVLSANFRDIIRRHKTSISYDRKRHMRYGLYYICNSDKTEI